MVTVAAEFEVSAEASRQYPGFRGRSPPDQQPAEGAWRHLTVTSPSRHARATAHAIDARADWLSAIDRAADNL